MASGKSAPSFKGELCLRRISVKVKFPAIAALWHQPDIRLKGTPIGFLQKAVIRPVASLYETSLSLSITPEDFKEHKN
ncbi:hypothetical protein [Roseovarius pacificus]|uniref:hypothetical protein n=1 Tax=Roseovarius pacificus TaxID=337701 RepID=UPI003748C2DB